jgi:hypothetical protein
MPTRQRGENKGVYSGRQEQQSRLFSAEPISQSRRIPLDWSGGIVYMPWDRQKAES